MVKVYEYYWKANDLFQQKRKGRQLSQSREMLENELIAKGYQQIRISRNFAFAQNPRKEEISRFLSQLALLLHSSIPLKQALGMILKNCLNIKMYQWLSEVIQSIENGYAFSYALEKSDTFMTNQEIQLIKMGECSGKLNLILANLAESRIKSDKLAKKVKKILFYPLIILSISLALSAGLLVFIVPQFAELYSAKGTSLPLITQILFTLSQCLIEYKYVLLVLPIIAVIFFFFFAKKNHWATKWKNVLFSHFPVFGQIIKQARIIFFSQNIALMLNAQLPLDIALKSFLSEKSDDPILQKALLFVLNMLKQGYSFSQGMNPEVFGSDTPQMIEIGEKSGNVGKMFEHISEIYQQKLDYQIDLLSQLLEPMLMLLMGAIVGAIMIGLYLPIFDMGSLVG